MPQPVISIITVCFNAQQHIEETIKSVVAQTYPAIEYIIIDGKSKDGTLAVVDRYRDQVAVLVSEPDKGLYDAMNKGLRAATGEYVMFLNADDVLYAPDTLEQALSHCHQADALYGEALFVDEQGNPLGLRSEVTPHQTPARLSWKSLRYGMSVSHQAFLIRRSLAPSYDLRYPVCADIDWMITGLKQCRTVCNTGQVICRFRIGGISQNKRRQGWKERFRILNRHYGAVPNTLRHGYIALRYLFSRK